MSHSMSGRTAVTRRGFGVWASAVAFGVASESILKSRAQSWTSVAWGAEGAERLPSADAFIAGKDSRLIVHSAKTGEIETPLALLREKRVTPAELLFVRNNQLLPDTLSLQPAESPEWKVEIRGLVDTPRSISVEQLGKLPQQDVELVLQCSGNSRSRFAKSVAAEGVPWQHGAMGNVVFRGVPLRAVIEHLGVRVQAAANFMAAEGKDAPSGAGAPDFEHSIPVPDALDRSLLALSLNGQPLPKIHGGPVRLVTPGYYATMNVKRLSTLRFEERESENHHHVGRYRTPLKPIAPGATFKSTLENSEPNWNMRIKSVIFSPLADEILPTGRVQVSGVAWNDGTAKIAAVEVSTDGGSAWRRAELTPGASPYAWHHWRAAVDLAAGQHTIRSRAIDALGRSQPLDGSVAWNPAGYAWNGVDEVEVMVR